MAVFSKTLVCGCILCKCISLSLSSSGCQSWRRCVASPHQQPFRSRGCKHRAQLSTLTWTFRPTLRLQWFSKPPVYIFSVCKSSAGLPATGGRALPMEPLGKQSGGSDRAPSGVRPRGTADMTSRDFNSASPETPYLIYSSCRVERFGQVTRFFQSLMTMFTLASTWPGTAVVSRRQHPRPEAALAWT